MNPELWKLKRDTSRREPIPRHEHSITNDHPAMTRMMGADAMPGKEMPVRPRVGAERRRSDEAGSSH